MTYRFEWIPAPLVVGVLLIPLIVPSFALIGLVVVALAAIAALAALAGAIIATPYLVLRTLRRRLEARQQSTEGSGPIAAAMAQAATAIAAPTTARRPQ